MAQKHHAKTWWKSWNIFGATVTRRRRVLDLPPHRLAPWSNPPAQAVGSTLKRRPCLKSVGSAFLNSKLRNEL